MSEPTVRVVYDEPKLQGVLLDSTDDPKLKCSVEMFVHPYTDERIISVSWEGHTFRLNQAKAMLTLLQKAVEYAERFTTGGAL